MFQAEWCSVGFVGYIGSCGDEEIVDNVFEYIEDETEYIKDKSKNNSLYLCNRLI